MIEIERDERDDTLHAMIVREAAMALQTSRSVLDVADAAARWVRSLSGFDRVMVYRFDADWNGEVIAERKRDDLNTFLGLHYPASDIPAQARELYRRNWLRLIPDIGYDVGAARAAGRPRHGPAARPEQLDAAQRVADPRRVPRQHGRRRVDVGVDRDQRRAVGADRLPPLLRARTTSASRPATPPSSSPS